MLLEAAASSGVRPQQQPHANASRVLVLCSLVALSFVAGQHIGAASVIVPSSHRELQSVERRLQSVDTCTAPCILPSVANLAVLCGTGGGGAATTSPPPAATAAPPSAATPATTDAATTTDDSSTSSSAGDGDGDGDGDGGAGDGDGTPTAGDAADADGTNTTGGGPAAAPTALPDGGGGVTSEGGTIAITVLGVLIGGVPCLITIGMVYMFCIKRP